MALSRNRRQQCVNPVGTSTGTTAVCACGRCETGAPRARMSCADVVRGCRARRPLLHRLQLGDEALHHTESAVPEGGDGGVQREAESRVGKTGGSTGRTRGTADPTKKT